MKNHGKYSLQKINYENLLVKYDQYSFTICMLIISKEVPKEGQTNVLLEVAKDEGQSDQNETILKRKPSGHPISPRNILLDPPQNSRERIPK